MQREKLKSLYYSNRIARAALSLPIWVRNSQVARKRQSAISAVDRLKALATEDIVLRVDAFDGDFQMPASSHLLLRLLIEGSYEPELASLARRHMNPTRDVIDVGANIGFYSVLAAKTVPTRKVLAIEPSTSANGRLVANLRRNGVSEQCIVFKGLAGASNTERDIQIIEGMEEYSSVATMEHYAVKGRNSHLERTAQSTVDSLVEQHALNPGFMKIDVEGFEMEVLRGARYTLAKCKPVILCEVSAPLLERNGTTASELFDCLKGHGYTLSDPMLPTVAPGDRKYGDVLAIPSE